MPNRLSPSARTSHRPVLAGAATAAALAAAVLAPVDLTGHPLVDAMERFLLVGGTTFVGAHARRLSWMFAAGLVAVPARGAALVLVLAALLVLVPALVPRRRSRDLGVVGLGILLNAPFWYGPDSLPWAPVLALSAFGLLIVSGRRYLRRDRRRYVNLALVGAAVALALAVVGVAIALVGARTSATRATQEAQQALDAARAGDAKGAREAVEQARQELHTARRPIESVFGLPARLVPGLAQQFDAIRVALREGSRITDRADDLVRTADYDTLSYDGRIDLDQVEDLVGPTARTTAQLEASEAALEDAGRGWLLPPLQSRIDDFARKVTEARVDTTLARDVIRVTPALFGGDGDRRYLVVFITPAELRGAGGFIGSYAELTAVDGDVDLTRSGRIMDLILAKRPGERTITGPADYVRRYGRHAPEDFLQDVTFSPDFPSDAQVLRQLYPQSGGSPIDGVISVDPRGLAALLKLTGPIEVDGLDEPLRAQDAEEVLLRQQYIDFPDEAQRGDILTEATRVTFERLTEGRLPAPREIADALSAPTREGHLRLWSPARAEEALFRDLGAAGELRIPEGHDGFSLVQQNAGNNKLDAYLRRSIAYHATVDARSGELRGRLTIELRNRVPSLDLPVAVVGNSRGDPPGTNIASLSLFTHHGIASATIDGKPARLGPDREQGLNAFDTPLLRIPPGGTVRIVLELEGGVDLSDGYDLRILPQPVANPDVLEAKLTVTNGRLPGRPGTTTTVVPEGPLGPPVARHVPVTR